ncbi:RNA polymerase sigma-70 factor [Mucilaginibacter mali]|uniref:RNA polymerase sigma-70 factor n=1 Tax=Mucilaginibacter mali TaxID=2740462 RepID=A0A7D4UC80_9SPHI|nr:RNA polymerase sigma-70 factor [Mucilaginibacter mali]QKJ29019.1 RNA polymerase sigma-70 factor [Mucilaginibacter mali]
MSLYTELTDAELIAAMRDGDEHAFREIYVRNSKLLIIYAHKKLKDIDEAKDVVQEVFANLWANRGACAVESNLSGYLYRCVLNKVLNIFRHKDISQWHVEGVQQLLDQGLPDTDYQVREKDIARVIEREIQALPPRMKEVFDLRRKEYLTNKQIAERLDISEHTVATQIKKTLKILRGRLGRELYSIFFLL